MSVCGVSIRQLSPVLLKDRQWSSARIAVEVSECLMYSVRKTCLFAQKRFATAAVKHCEECPEEGLPEAHDVPSSLPEPRCLKAISQHFITYSNGMTPTEDNVRWKENICQLILKDIHTLYPMADLQMFGSSVNGFGSPKSDLDLCLLHRGLNERKDARRRRDVIQQVATAFQKSKGRYREVVAIKHSRTPIIKLYLPQRKISCDISFNNRLALHNTRLLACYAKLDRRVRPLGYALKRFAKECDMGDASAGSLSSYAYILMLIHYLQRTSPPVLPVLQQVYTTATQPQEPIVDSWNCYFYQFKNPQELHRVWRRQRNESCVGQLWLGLLRYYAVEFDWLSEVVSIRRLEPVSKLDKKWHKRPMAIEDPFDLCHNLASRIGITKRKYIVERFQAALRYHSSNIQWRSIEHLIGRKSLQKLS